MQALCIKFSQILSAYLGPVGIFDCPGMQFPFPGLADVVMLEA